MNITIGQVKIRFGFGGVEVAAPIAGKAVQINFVPLQSRQQGIGLQLIVDSRYVGEVEIKTNAIPF